MGGARTAGFFGEGDAEHGGGEATDAGSLIGEEGFAEVADFGGSS